MNFILKAIFLVFLVTFFNASAQDFIIKQNGTFIKAKVKGTDLNNVFYKLFEDTDGQQLFIKKTDVAEIKFESGKTEYFGVPPAYNTEASEENTKKFILDQLNTHAYEDDDFKRHLHASFDGDFLVITILNKKGENDGNSKTYDFSKVYTFRRVDRRSEKVAFINSHVAFLKSQKNNVWERIKLTIAFDNAASAESTLNAFKQYNALLLKKGKNSMF